MNQLLVVGGASFDTLHLQEQSVACVGGAGMYTAMAAHRSGAKTAMFSPVPDPCPELLLPVVQRLTDWIGPAVSPAELPQFEISYRHGQTEYLQMSFGAETTLSPAMLPADLSAYDHVHVTAVFNAETQLSFVQACRQRGVKRLSAGTYLVDVEKQAQAVHAIMEQTDYFFMNGHEARALFGSIEAVHATPGRVIFVTLGREGALIVQGQAATLIPAATAAEVDPTGAGDTFCGATLAYLLQKHQPIMAAHRAAALAAEMIGHVGPAALLLDDPPPDVPHDPRVRVKDEQVRRVSQQISTLTESKPFPFVGPVLPQAGHPKALDYFFAATLQQFSFWTARHDHYHRPMIAQIGGVQHKGSDYLWDAFRRQVEVDAEFCSPDRQANLSRDELLAVFRADDGRDPMPALDLHLEQARQYGRDMLALQLTTQAIVQESLASAQPLATFLTILDHIGGYKEDPLRKKSSLLAIILNQRPERFLPLPENEQVAPVIDYHLMRSCLRVGLVDVLDEALASKLVDRRIISPAEEWAVRFAAYRAIEQLVDLSGVSTGLVDELFFNARKYCPEMSDPECRSCQLDPVCAHRKELFQPVLRTIYY